MRREYKEHSFANYPSAFRGCKVSPTKICMQFTNAEVKCRENANKTDSDSLPKDVNCDHYIPVSRNGIVIGCTAIGCQMPVIEQCQFQLIESYKEYYKNFKDTYKQVYDEDFIDFIKFLKSKVDSLLSYMEKNSNGS